MSRSRTGAEVHLDLGGPDGNVFVIIGSVGRVIRLVLGRDIEREYRERCTAARSYEEVLAITNEYVTLTDTPMVRLEDD
jgi:hypothetical protein